VNPCPNGLQLQDRGENRINVLVSSIEGNLQAGFSSAMNTTSNTVKDVAKLAGVSIATVSRVVNGTCKVSDNARARVLSAIADLEYHPDLHAVELRRGRARNSRRSGNCRDQVALCGSESILFSRQSGSRNIERLRSLENENARLRKLVASLSKVLKLEMQRIQMGGSGLNES
jgi:transcriptional regulator with XRE-family HTH domain